MPYPIKAKVEFRQDRARLYVKIWPAKQTWQLYPLGKQHNKINHTKLMNLELLLKVPYLQIPQLGRFSLLHKTDIYLSNVALH